MRPAIFLSISLLATAAFAANMRFDPPNPTSRTPVTAHVIGNFSTCSPTVMRNGTIIDITLENCSLQSPPPLVDVPADLGIVPAGIYDVVVGYPVILIGVAEGTLIVQDAAPPFQVTPNAGMPGDVITIRGKLLGTGVTFGGVGATVVNATSDQLVVRAPQHDSGPVDVESAALHSTAAFYYVPNNGPPDPAFYEPLLIPVAFTGSGAFGSQWTTEVSLRNENDFPLEVLPLNSLSPECNLISLGKCAGNPPARSTAVIDALSAPQGLLTYLPRQAAPKVHLGLLVRDLSRQAQSLGTQIPVVREKDFFDRPLELLNVPTDPRFRVSLRVYDLGTPNGIHCTIQPLSGDETLVDTFVFPAGHDPSYAQISDLVATYPQLAGKGPLRITIDPPIAGNPTLWAFASVTNNDTQQVTAISPE